MNASTPLSLFKTVLFGYLVDMGVLFIPMFLLIAFPSMVGQANIGPVKTLVMAAMLPVILLIQGVMLGVIVKLGWWIIGKVRRP